MTLRENLASTPLDSHRLRPNQNLVSHKGIPFHTNQWGFRCKKEPSLLPNATNLLLGGDSIAFGMYLPFEQSLGHHLQLKLYSNFNVLVSAIPGGSQAMSHDLLFGPDQLAQKVKAKWLLHSVNHYDDNDNWLYEIDEEKRRGLRGELRKAKNLLGPYAIQMLQLKTRHFLSKDQRKDLLLYADEIPQPNPTKWGHTQRALEKLQKVCLDSGIHLALFFLPDRGELSSQGDQHNDTMEAWAKAQSIPFLDLEKLLEREPPSLKEQLFKSDGIHLTPSGSQTVAKHLAFFMNGLEL